MYKRQVQGEDNAEAAKKFALEHKLDQDGLQNVYYFLNRKAAAQGNYKRASQALPRAGLPPLMGVGAQASWASTRGSRTRMR